MSAPAKVHIAAAVTDDLPGIQRLAREFGVERLEVYGDAEGELPSRTYPVHFIVTYPGGYDLGPWGERWMDLADELSHMVGRETSLLMSTTAVDNPSRRKNIEETRRTVYAAS